MKVIDGGKSDDNVVDLDGFKRQREAENRYLLEGFVQSILELAGAVRDVSLLLGCGVVFEEDINNNNDDDDQGHTPG